MNKKSGTSKDAADKLAKSLTILSSGSRFPGTLCRYKDRTANRGQLKGAWSVPGGTLLFVSKWELWSGE